MSFTLLLFWDLSSPITLDTTPNCKRQLFKSSKLAGLLLFSTSTHLIYLSKEVVSYCNCQIKIETELTIYANFVPLRELKWIVLAFKLLLSYSNNNKIVPLMCYLKCCYPDRAKKKIYTTSQPVHPLFVKVKWVRCRVLSLQFANRNELLKYPRSQHMTCHVPRCRGLDPIWISSS